MEVQNEFTVEASLLKGRRGLSLIRRGEEWGRGTKDGIKRSTVNSERY